MSTVVRDNVPTLTAVLSLVSIALVVGAVRGLLPMGALPQVDPLLGAIPHLNAVLSLVAIATIVAGVRAIRRGDVRRHRSLMLTSLGLFATFLALYLYRVGVEGPTAFDGPDAVYTFLYLPVLVIHMGLAIVCIPLLYYVLLLAVSRPVSQLSETRHPSVGKVAAALWVTSFALGTAVYAMLYWVY
ncbi:DUF420 domain-containing protein [Halobacteriales archaeon Cl-PHB]